MPYVFRLHTTGIEYIQGWEPSNPLYRRDIESIPEISFSKKNFESIDSSIPTPLASLYLFEKAFQVVYEEPDADTPYHQLVSDCLDLYQFIYLYARRYNLTIKRWGVIKQIKELKASDIPAHQQLATSLEFAFNSSKFKGIEELYLIYYEGYLVGGTSPLTGVFTSRNWRRIMIKEGLNFKTPGGRSLFGNASYSIVQREERFQLYMYKFLYAYRSFFGTKSTSFFEYFHSTRRRTPEIDQLCLRNNLEYYHYTQKQLFDDYDGVLIDDEMNNMTFMGAESFSLVTQKAARIPEMIQEESDFVMVPTQEFYKSEIDENDNLLNNYPPLVLVKGNHNLNYIDTKWDQDIQIPDVAAFSINNRTLPAYETYEYPFVTTEDFLEEVLFELPFNIDPEYFYTGFFGGFNYLIPVKKKYFNYFSLQDLERQLSIIKEDNVFTLKLQIPVKGSRTISLVKTYDLDEPGKVIKSKETGQFNIGFFPFYQVVDKEEWNRYCISLVSNIENLELNFYKYSGVVNDEKIHPTYVGGRTKVTKDRLGSTYYDIRRTSFDFVEVYQEQLLRGLILLKMKKVRKEEGYRKYKFAIDLGTTNTHVAYSMDSGRQNDIRSFDIRPDDRQMVLLSERNQKHDNLDEQINSGLGAFTGIDLMNREFVPGFISESTRVCFPTKSVIYEKRSNKNHPEILFGNSNIGFDFGEKTVEDDHILLNDHYITDLKSNFADKVRKGRLGAKRIKIFLEEIIWLIKNKIFMNEGRLDSPPVIVLLISASLTKKQSNIFKRLLIQAGEDAFGENFISPKIMFDSITPKYFLRKEGVFFNALNIDIGGATTNVYIETEARMHGRCTTVFNFAGNDIWGEGANDDQWKRQDNGFLRLIHAKMENREVKLKDESLESLFYGLTERRSLGSIDICSFLFKHDKEFGFSNHIMSHPSMVTILIFHLGAILFQVAQIIRLKSFEIPEMISFTGRGSKYLELITKDKRALKAIIKLMLELFTEGVAPNSFELKMIKNPKKITAEGALMEMERDNLEDVEQIKFLGAQFSEYDFSKEEREHSGKIKYKDIETLDRELTRNVIIFLEMMQDEKLKILLSGIDVKYKYRDFDIIKFIEEYGRNNSFKKIAAKRKLEIEPDDVLEENLFFWYFKDTLYELSKILYK